MHGRMAHGVLAEDMRRALGMSKSQWRSLNQAGKREEIQQEALDIASRIAARDDELLERLVEDPPGWTAEAEAVRNRNLLRWLRDTPEA